MIIRLFALLALLFTATFSHADMIGSGDDVTSDTESITTTETEQSWWNMLVDWFVDDES